VHRDVMQTDPRAVLLFLVLSSCRAALAKQELYTTNAVCLRKHCINPIFPALEDLQRLSESTWYCSSLRKAGPAMGFCRGAISYDPALQAPVGLGQDIATIVRKQDSAAATMFVYHMSGLGFEAWDYSNPEHSDDDCVKSIWRMVCYTYFPRAQIGCQEGMQTTYLRPCKSSCQNYIRMCGVECCDESVQCVFTHTKVLGPSESVTTAGYLPHDGPSTLCTGGAPRSRAVGAASWLVLFLALRTLEPMACAIERTATGPRALRLTGFGVLVFAALSLQGCDYDVPSHKVGNWRTEDDYLIDFQFVPPGGSPRDGLLNSCSLDRLSPTLQCSGRGVCKIWDVDNLQNPTAFCECERDWADPECKTRRKSQAVAFLLSLFFGFLGADHFYLGFKESGVAKLFTLGGGGLWWVFDFIRIGSAPVPSKHFRLAADLPHWVFVLTTVSFAMTMGYIIAHAMVMKFRADRRKDAMLHSEQEEAHPAAPEPRHPPHRPEHPKLKVGEMQLKHRPSPSPTPSPTPPPNYGATENPVSMPVPRGSMGPPRTVRDGSAFHSSLEQQGNMNLGAASRAAPGAALDPQMSSGNAPPMPVTTAPAMDSLQGAIPPGAPVGSSFLVPRGSQGPPRSVNDGGALYRAHFEGVPRTEPGAAPGVLASEAPPPVPGSMVPAMDSVQGMIPPGAPVGTSFMVPRGSQGPPRSVNDGGALYRAHFEGRLATPPGSSMALPAAEPAASPAAGPGGNGGLPAPTPMFTPSSVSSFTPPAPSTQTDYPTVNMGPMTPLDATR